MSTVQELINTLQQFEGHKPVELKIRLKTGYDEGSIFTCAPTSFEHTDNKLSISGTWNETGGW